MDAVAKKEGHICHTGLIGVCGWCSHGSHPKEKTQSHSMHGTGALQETNISPQKWHFESMSFQTSRLVGYVIVPWRFITYLQFGCFFLMGFHVGKIYVPVLWIDFGGVLDDFASEKGCFGVVFGDKTEDEIWITWILPPQPGRDTTRWAPTSCKWSYNLYKWPYKWVTGVITLLMGVITPFTTDRGPPCTRVLTFLAASLCR